MNIIFLLRLWPIYGGGETVTICLANELVKRGHNVTVAYFKNNGKCDEIDNHVNTLLINNIDCDEFHMNKKDALKAQEELISYIKLHHVDVVINQWWTADYISLIKERTNCKVISCLHQAFFTPILDSSGFSGFMKKMLKPIYIEYKKKRQIQKVNSFLPYVDKFLFLSYSFQKQYQEFSKNKDKNLQLFSIPNPSVFKQYITFDEMKDKSNTVLIVARMLEGQKKITRALRIWKKIEANATTRGWNLQIVGEGPDLDFYKQYSRDLDLKRVSFLGFQKPLPYYKKARIFMMTSQFEGFSMTLIESQQMGVIPVVMDSFLSLKDILKNGENGFIIKNGDEIGFAEKMIQLMNEPIKLNELAIKGMETCKKFSVENIVDKWEDLIRNIR